MPRAFIRHLKEEYPKGTRIELELMNDPFAPIEPGTRGTVVNVDDAGQIHMQWDNGRSLVLVPTEDDFRKLTLEEIMQEQNNISDNSINEAEPTEDSDIWENLLPIGEEKAVACFLSKNINVYKVYDDNTESLVESLEEIDEHSAKGGIFGVEQEEPPIVEESIYIIEKFNNTENVEFIAASFDIHEAIRLMNETWNNLPEAEKENTTFKTGTKTVDVPYGASAKEKIAKLDNDQPNRAWTKNSQPLAEASLNHTDSNRMLIVPPGDNPYDAYVYDSLEALQGMVDGDIECTYPFNDNAFVIGNNEARLNVMQGNRRINGEIYAGTILVAADDGCCGTKDLTEEQVREYAGKLWQPEDISPAEVADVHYSYQTFNSEKEFFAALGLDM